jgi:phospholipid/cholesterol/gamma-HCH transport system substrate-binding protein
MKIRREFKIGVFAVIVIAVAWWGIKWLGGQNVLLTSDIYYVYYDDVSGLQESSRVKLRGVDVGNVRDITLERDRVMVEIAIESQYRDMIPVNSIAEMGASGLMGGVEIAILQGDAAEIIEAGAVMQGRMKADMLGSLADQGAELIEGLNKTVEGVNTLLDSNTSTITNLIANLESMSSSIDRIVNSSAGDIEVAVDNLSSFTTLLAENTGRVESMLENLDTFSGDLAEADMVNKLNATVESLNAVLTSLESGEGSVGLLLHDAELYNKLTTAGDNLGLLLEDLKSNPMRYVHFSLFGTSDEKLQEKQAKKEARAEKRAAKQNN